MDSFKQTNQLYFQASQLDQEEYGWPLCLALTAVFNQFEAFKQLLKNTAPNMSKANKMSRYEFHDKIWELKDKKYPQQKLPFRPTSAVLFYNLCNLGRTEMIRLLFAKVDIGINSGGSGNGIDEGGGGWSKISPDGPASCISLLLAINGRHEKTVKLLLEAGVNPSYTGEYTYHLTRLSTLSYALIKQTTPSANLLIDYGTDLKGEGEETPFNRACNVGNFHIFKRLIDLGVVSTVEELTLGLRKAIRTGQHNPAAFRFLLEAGATVNDDIMIKAAKYMDLESVKLLMKYGGDIYARSPGGYTLLHCARDLRLMRFLIDAMPDMVNVKDQHESTPLDTAYSRGRQSYVRYPLEILRTIALMLLEAGGEVHKFEPDLYNASTLTFAVTRGHEDVVKGLVGLESQKPTLDELYNGETVLHTAISHRYFNIAELLINAGICLSAEERIFGDTALHTAVKLGVEEHRKVEGYVNMAGLVLLGDPDASVQDVCGESALHDLAHSGYMKCMRLLIAAGADLPLNAKSQTPLDILALHQSRMLPRHRVKNIGEVTGLGPSSESQRFLRVWVDGENCLSGIGYGLEDFRDVAGAIA